MPPSQLKRLKSSLREQGIVGPQQSRKQKKQNAQNGANKNKRNNRKVALEGIREQFNPFEFKPAGGKAPKFEVTSMEKKKIGVTRPGQQRSREQEISRAQIESDMYNKNKVGGILDKRFGEMDHTMTPEEKMLERFTRAQNKGKGAVFDLENDDDEGGLELTHMGKSLSLDGPEIKDDFDEDDLEEDEERSSRKRRRSDLEEDDEGDEGENQESQEHPGRKKSKQEVMKELIAKSKLYKYERQAVKDDDDDLREELDAEISNIHALLRGIGVKQPPPPTEIVGMNPDRAALLHGTEKKQIEKDYDLRLRQLAQDERSKPTEKSKTQDEILAEKAQKLQELESKRLRRMEGAHDSDEEDVRDSPGDDDADDTFGLGSGIKTKQKEPEAGFDDEDQFEIDDDLVYNGSDISSDAEQSSQDDESQGEDDEDEDDDDDFGRDLLTNEEASRPEFLTGANAPLPDVELPSENGVNGNLPFNFDCPLSHDELLENISRKTNILDLPEVIRRIRTQYNLTLRVENKTKVGKFSVVLVDHISYLGNQEQRTPFSILETVIRHIHSLAKTFPVEIANAFRRHLNEMSNTRALAPLPGDLVILTAIGTIFPTSDHFHQVATPALLTMGRYLGLKIPQNLSDHATGSYLCTLCLHYQRLSKRYVPEVMNFLENSLCVIAPKKFSRLPGIFPPHEPKTPIHIETITSSPRKLKFYDCVNSETCTKEEEEELKLAIVDADLKLLSNAASLWADKSAFTEIFEPVSTILKHLRNKACQSKLPESTNIMVSQLAEKINVQLSIAHSNRRPMELHHHRPLAIKMSIPKFEESFNPDRHYDPDKERTEAAKLKKEYKREHKGATRQLKKDARLTASTKLREKRERDEAYEKKYKRLVAEIQGEEGKERNAYDREREWRKKGRK